MRFRFQYTRVHCKLQVYKCYFSFQKKSARWYVDEKEHQNTVASTAAQIPNSMVDCLFCGAQMWLSLLIDHQIFYHAQDAKNAPQKNVIHFRNSKNTNDRNLIHSQDLKKANVICTLCNHSMPSTSLAKHQKRKHSETSNFVSKLNNQYVVVHVWPNKINFSGINNPQIQNRM